MARLIHTAQAEANGALTIVRMCRPAQITRAQFYRHRRATAESRDVELHTAVKAVALEMPSDGYRRVTAQLRRGGRRVNGKTVLRAMRQQELLCKRRHRFCRTTDSQHAHRVYPNLARQMKVTGINQLWRAFITYVRLVHGFVYLAAILDAYSRRCVGWAISRSLDTEVALAALHRALATRKVGDGLVHHSDRGVQYASGDYTDLLKERLIQISMSRRGNPYDNARCERFMRTLKEEEVYLSEYETMNEARQSIAHFIEAVYNKKRLHSALGYLPPAAVRAATLSINQCLTTCFVSGVHYKQLTCSTPLSVLPVMTEDLLEEQEISRRSPDTVTFGFAARLEHLKGLLVLIEAFASLYKSSANSFLKIAGIGSQQQQAASRIKKAGVATRCQLIGAYDQVKEKTAFMRSLDVFVLPSLTEGTPNSFVEAMACGLPVIASDVGGIADMVTAQTGILVPPGDSTALAIAMSQLAADQDLRARMGRAARQRYEQVFSPKAVMPVLLSTYERIAATKHQTIATALLSSSINGFHPWDNNAQKLAAL